MLNTCGCDCFIRVSQSLLALNELCNRIRGMDFHVYFSTAKTQLIATRSYKGIVLIIDGMF